MAHTDIFRQQHIDLLRQATEIQHLLEGALHPETIENILEKLSDLTAALKQHLVQEDQTLYPRMLYSDDETVAVTAQAFHDEVGNLGRLYVRYTDYWNTVSRIQAKPDQFIEETGRIFAFLRTRVQKENSVLFPLADTL